jgi:hypothetical protein
VGDQEQTTSEDGTATRRTAGRRPGSRRPIWRRGWFWVAVIAVEVAVALLVSFSFERSPTEVDVTGGDLAAFCTEARARREQGFGSNAAGEGTGVDDPSRFIAERDAYRALVATAPPDLVVDLEELAEGADQLVAAVEDIAERKAADPTYSGLAELDAALERAGVENKVAAARVSLVLREQCQILPEPDVATTTAPPAVTVPGTQPR